MELYEQNKEYWTGRTMGYSKVNEEELNTAQKEKWLRVLKESLPQNTAGIRVLDMGTGPGFFAIILAEAGYDVTAVDCTQSMLDRAKVNAKAYKDSICWVLSDAQRLEFEDESFDAIVSRNLTWNLEKPEQAYGEWIRVLKKGGILLNFDATWYNYLYDEEMKQGYERDRRQVEELKLEDHYTCTDIDAMEGISRKLPLSRCSRPGWDIELLKKYGVAKIQTDQEVWKRVWSQEEQVNYGSTPMFSIRVIK
ncbi:MAG TPA: methyltransferase domain-containing protein [Clostridiales bacterium]|nr:methyltransferase domain-containing protein [Clostridiales bacterium]